MSTVLVVALIATVLMISGCALYWQQRYVQAARAHDELIDWIYEAGDEDFRRELLALLRELEGDEAA